MKHYHIYRRMKSPKNYFQCIDPRCTHRDARESIDGKIAVCPFGDPAQPHTYTLDWDALRRVLPHCGDCLGMTGSTRRKPEVHESNIGPPRGAPQIAHADPPASKRREFEQTNSETGKIEPMPGEDLARLQGPRTTKPGLPQKSAAPTQEPPSALSAKQRKDSNRVRRDLSALGVPETEIEPALRSLLSSQH